MSRFRSTRTASTAARGYGADHQRARREFAANHRPSDPCARCGRPLGEMGPWLHLDHSRTRDEYLGFSHGHCNVVAGAVEGSHRAHRSALARRAAQQRGQSRRW